MMKIYLLDFCYAVHTKGWPRPDYACTSTKSSKDDATFPHSTNLPPQSLHLHISLARLYNYTFAQRQSEAYIKKK